MIARRAHLLRAAATMLALVAGTSAAAQTVRTTLPVPRGPFAGTIREQVEQSTPAAPTRVRAPAGAPNILLVMSDDVGFGISSAFGGPVPTPNLERLAAAGQRFNRFHTTGICSPTRAALLTGRNHHNAGTGMLTNSPSGFPGYEGRIPPETATIAQMLRLNGYSTAMFGKHHNITPGEGTPAGPFDSWPTGLGFDYFYGFLDGDVDQWSPVLYRGTNRLPDRPADAPPELLDKRLADDAITWVHNQKAGDPDKPFFLYYAPGSLHAPHQALPEYIARFRGAFDQGWDKVREETYQRQLAAGIIPPGTKLTPRPDGIPAWTSLSPQQRAFAARSMEVAAAMLTYQDEQIGRLLAELDRMGVLDTTLVAMISGDNGASGEGGPRGTLNELGHLSNGIKEDDAYLASTLDKQGGPETYQLYPAGWAWAMNTPLRWTKQYASMLGGIRNDLVIAWKGHVAHPGATCARFGHVVDMAPTLMAAAGLPFPTSVYGAKQKPFDGQSLLPSLATCDPDAPRTQYFEMMGKVGLYKDGWFAGLEDGRKPWDNAPPSGVEPSWSLYDLRTDFSQSDDVAARFPERLKSMIAAWQVEAKKNQVFPLDHRFGAARGGLSISPRLRFDYWGRDVSVPAFSGPFFAGRSFTLDAEVTTAKAGASGAIVAVGSHHGGWSLLLDRGKPVLAYALSDRPDETYRIVADRALGAGPQRLRLTVTSEGLGAGASVELASGDTVIASGRLPRTFLIPAALGEMLDTGRDTGVPVTTYRTPHGEFEGEVSHVVLTFKPGAPALPAKSVTSMRLDQPRMDQ